MFVDNNTFRVYEEPKITIIELLIERKIENMSLEEKIAQMVIISCETTEYDDLLKKDLQSYQPGGFIIFRYNIKSYQQISDLVTAMQNDSKIPMFISVDQEGGRVQRFKNIAGVDLTVIPSMAEVGLINDEEYAFVVGKTIGEELKIFGVNMDFAPCLDVLGNSKNTVIGNRSFGSNPETVSKMGLAVAEGIRQQGVIVVYKHFPGHGTITEDSHFNLPVLKKTKEQLYDFELIPFIAAVKEECDVIMIGHISLPSITGNNTPASLSKEVLDILRIELNYKGIIITDALDMKAIKDNYQEDEIIIMAINAGVDILLMPEGLESTIAIVKKAIEENTISIESIDNSVKRILMLKSKYGILKLHQMK